MISLIKDIYFKSRRFLLDEDLDNIDTVDNKKIEFKNSTFYNHRYLNTSLDMWNYQLIKLRNKKSNIVSNFIYSKLIIDNIEGFVDNVKMFRRDSNIVQIENFLIIYIAYSTSEKNYIIDWNDNNIIINYPKSFELKLKAVKYIIQIINEEDPKYVNMTNYSNLVMWFVSNISRVPRDERQKFLEEWT
jgi:hypothetical protein